MYKIITCIVKSLMFLAITNNCFSQTETFDIATYTPPKDWKKVTGDGVVSYTIINTLTGTFCVLTMYTSSASLGDAQKDFKAEWKGLLVTPHQAEANPKTDAQTSPDGWKSVSAAAPIKIDSIDAYAILTVISGFGRKFSIMTTLNDQTYAADVDLFLKNIQLDKSAKTDAPVVLNTNLSIIGT